LDFKVPESKLTDDQVRFLNSVDSPTISNAIEAFKVRDRTTGFLGGEIRCLLPDLGVMVGHALTVTVGNEPGDVHKSSMASGMWNALAEMPKPVVIVMKDVSGRPNQIAYAGEVMATLAKRLGAVGMVTDGGLRDLNEVHDLGFHYHAAYLVVSHGNFEILDVGVPIEIAGQHIETGDILHGDANGIVVIPAETVGELENEVAKVREREKRLMDYIKGDTFSLEGVQSGRGY
jgi:4-hydroxy-4-methyl-2-oxoglutarate aldolase